MTTTTIFQALPEDGTAPFFVAHEHSALRPLWDWIVVGDSLNVGPDTWLVLAVDPRAEWTPPIPPLTPRSTGVMKVRRS